MVHDPLKDLSGTIPQEVNFSAKRNEKAMKKTPCHVYDSAPHLIFCVFDFFGDCAPTFEEPAAKLRARIDDKSLRADDFPSQVDHATLFLKRAEFIFWD